MLVKEDKLISNRSNHSLTKEIHIRLSKIKFITAKTKIDTKYYEIIDEGEIRIYFSWMVRTQNLFTENTIFRLVIPRWRRTTSLAKGWNEQK